MSLTIDPGRESACIDGEWARGASALPSMFRARPSDSRENADSADGHPNVAGQLKPRDGVRADGRSEGLEVLDEIGPLLRRECEAEKRDIVLHDGLQCGSAAIVEVRPLEQGSVPESP